MKEFATPLAERQRISRWHKQRYQSDSAFRLRNVNRWRIWKGLEPYTCASQIKSLADVGRTVAARAERDDKGRFV